MIQKNIAQIALTLLFLMSTLSANSQPKSSFSPGEILLANNTLIVGQVWMANTLEGKQIIYFKEDEKDPTLKFYPDDIQSIEIYSGQYRYVSETISVDEILKRVILQVHFKGEFDLLSYYNPKSNLFYLVDNTGQFVELQNSFETPSKENNYKFKFAMEYKQTLTEVLGGHQQILNQIQTTEFNPKDLSNLLITYHKKMGIAYETYPSRKFSGFSLAMGPVFSLLSHTSDINDDFITNSPFAGIGVRGGVHLFKDKMEVSLLANYNYGITTHDNFYESSDLLTIFYEDFIKTSIINLGLGLNFKPLTIDKISLDLSLGAYSNHFLNYTREVTEELFYVNDGVMISNFYDGFQKPDSYYSASFGGGLEYDISKTTSVLLNYSMSIIFESNSGNNNMHGISILINKKFN